MSSRALRLPYGRLDSERPLRVPVGPADRVRGEGQLMMVIYEDFECPDCQAFYLAFNELPQELWEQVRMAHRHFPLVSSRPRAMQSALAVEAAHVQGAFWPMYDRLLTMARDRAPRELDRIAQELVLDVARFREDLLNRAHTDRIWVHVRGVRESGVSATPWSPPIMFSSMVGQAIFHTAGRSGPSAMDRS